MSTVTFHKPQFGIHLTATIFLLLLVAWLFIYDPVMINNGDYSRLFRGFLEIKAFTPFPECQAINSRPILFNSSANALFVITASLFDVFSNDCFNLKIFPWVSFAVLASGAIISVRIDPRNTKTICAILLFSFICSPFLSSYFEESVILPLSTWVVAGHSLILKNKPPLLFCIASCALLFSKAQMVIFLPFFFILIVGYYKSQKIGISTFFLCGTLMLCTCAAIMVAKSHNVGANSYNRLYNGIGWSVLDVKDWPARNFNERHDFFYENQTALQEKSNIRIPNHSNNLLGTSYWPTGLAANQRNDAVSVQLIESQKPSFYIETLLSQGIVFSMLKNTYNLAIASDFSMRYLRTNINIAPNSIHTVRDFLLEHLGWVCILFSTCMLMCTRGSLNKVISLLFVCSLPLFIVLGDGFYEFEKHLITFYMSLPLAWLLDNAKIKPN